MKDLLELSSGRSFYFPYQLLCQLDWIAQELAVVKISVKDFLGHQTLVVPGLNDVTMVQYDDLVSVSDRRQAVGHDQAGPLLLQVSHGISNQGLLFGIAEVYVLESEFWQWLLH